jgi:hypothetical protein
MPLRDALAATAPRALTVRERVGLSAAELRDRANRPLAARRQSQLQNRQLRRYDALPDTLECACAGELRKTTAQSKAFVCDRCDHRVRILADGSPQWLAADPGLRGTRNRLRAGEPDIRRNRLRAGEHDRRVDRHVSRMRPRAVQRLDAELAKRRRITQQLNALAVQPCATGLAGLPPSTSPRRGPDVLSPDEDALLDRAVAPFIAPVPALPEAPTT